MPVGTLQTDGTDVMPYEPQTGALDTPESDAEASERGPDERAIFWEKQITAALIHERRWRTEAEHAENLYFGPDEDPTTRDAAAGAAHNPISETTSTIHGNIDVLKPLLFSETPTPIVQRRFRGDGKRTDETDVMAAEVGQRIAQWILGTTRFDEAMEGVRDDWLIAGRGTARAFYRAEFATDPLTGAERKTVEEVYAKHWEWRRLVIPPGYSWDRAPWIAFEVPLTRRQVERQFSPDLAARMAYNRAGLIDRSRVLGTSDNAEIDRRDEVTTSGEVNNSPFDTTTAWEIHNRDERKVLWWSPDCSREIMGEIDDPLQLEHFWPCPKPLLATTKGSSMTPRPDIRYYEAAAKEVETATTKMAEILNVIAVAGLYPGKHEQEIRKLLSGKNALYAAEAWFALLDKGGTRDLIQWLPLEPMVAALNALATLREQAKQRMFEASGVSDIMRAQGDPRETATAQNLKGRYAGLRLASRQRAMAIYARDMLRILVEIAVEMFDTAYLAEICALDLPLTEAEREAMIAQEQAVQAAYAAAVEAHAQVMAQRQAMEQMAAQQGGTVTLPPPPPPPAPPPEGPRIPGTSWELVHARLRDDLGRKITITIETQSTILVDEQEDKEARIEFLAAFAAFVEQIMPLVGSGQFDLKTTKELLLFGVRAFPKARTLESLISDLPDEMPQGQDKPDVQVQVAQIRAEVDLEIQRMKMADAEAERAHETRLKGVELAAEAARLAAEPDDPPPAPPGSDASPRRT